MASISETQQARDQGIVRIPQQLDVVCICDELTEEMSDWRSRLHSNSSNCCIYRVPERFWLIKGEGYKPRIVSIGPYYKLDDKLRSNKGYKLQCLNSMLSRTNLTLEGCFESIMPLEKMARECYSGYVFPFASFLEIMVVDSCFILELFRKYNNPRSLKPDDPLTMIFPYIYGDLLLLECQIPFFVLEKLFDISKMPDENESLSLLALQFFNSVMKRPNEVIEKYVNDADPPLHLLDLVRSSLIPNDSIPPQLPQKYDYTPTQFIRCISKLRRAGIKVRPCNADTFLAVKFKRGVIELPIITITSFMKLLLGNCVAFEQLHKSSSKHVTVYATFLGCLVNTSEDVQYLRERNVIDNYDVDDSVESFMKGMSNVSKDLAIGMGHSYLFKVFNDVNKHYWNAFNVQFTSFTQRYFYTRWPFVSFLAATVLLLLTFVQTYFAIIGYVYPKN